MKSKLRDGKDDTKAAIDEPTAVPNALTKDSKRGREKEEKGDRGGKDPTRAKPLH